MRVSLTEVIKELEIPRLCHAPALELLGRLPVKFPFQKERSQREANLHVIGIDCHKRLRGNKRLICFADSQKGLCKRQQGLHVSGRTSTRDVEVLNGPRIVLQFQSDDAKVVVGSEI